MGLLKDFFNNTRKPEGRLGKLMVGTMNDGHAAIAAWGSQFVDVAPDARVLDVGCGGGATIRSYLMGCERGRVDGVDLSEVSVDASRSLNARAIADGRCRIERGSVADLPFDDASYDLVSAFETVYFWPELTASFAEVLRVLVPGGRLLVVNGSTGTDAGSAYFTSVIDGMRSYTADQLRTFMEQAGFADVVIHVADDKPWISVIGTKPGASATATRLRDEGPDYANWIPADLVRGSLAVAAMLGGGWALASALRAGRLAPRVLGAVAAGAGAFAAWCQFERARFSYRGPRKLSKQIVEGTAAQVILPDGGSCLDVGCGSGALSIAVARRNPHASVTGIDPWGADYAAFSKELCERNAAAEGVSNVRFMRGDATALPFDDESFDAVTSNYVYHNIVGANKQQLLRETLRCLRKGGTFAIHDLMSTRRYGNMEAFCQSLRDEGYEEVRLVRTDQGLFMDRSEATPMRLTGSALLLGRK